MRLTVYTDFSLRVLIFLALKGDSLATIAEIAGAYRISKNHLMKIVHQLGLAGYVETARGKGGGLRLARPPEEILIGHVVRRTEPDMSLVPCFDPSTDSCAISPGCALRGVLSEATSAFLSVLDGYTLADLIHSRAPLQKALALDVARRRHAGSRRVARAHPS
jgi:Rrf2 family transcriptional regulator, nitric oxide-sensitive transcriptional repressor